jgi:hypothetical protein
MIEGVYESIQPIVSKIILVILYLITIVNFLRKMFYRKDETETFEDIFEEANAENYIRHVPLEATGSGITIKEMHI